jgi:hypothetical protein
MGCAPTAYVRRRKPRAWEPAGGPGKTGDRRDVSGLRATVVLFARGPIRTRHRPGHPAPCDTARQFILTTDAERLVYLGLLRLSVVPAPLFIAETSHVR